MADVRDEYQVAMDAARDMESADDVQTALVHGFHGLANILLAILLELREAREGRVDA
jgi:hypothetical protein